MKIKNFIYVLGGALLLSACAQNNSSEETKIVKPSNLDGKIVKDEYIISLKSSAIKPALNLLESKDYSREEKFEAMSKLNKKVLANLDEWIMKAGINPADVTHKYSASFVGFTAKMNPEIYNKIQRNNEIESIEHNTYTDLPEYEVLGDATRGTSGPRMDEVTCAVTNAGGSAFAAKDNRWIYIIDSGIDTDHPDLNVITDSRYAKNFSGSTGIEDCRGHGTHVAGIAGARFNSIGVVGVAADAFVVPVRVFGCDGVAVTDAQIIAGMDHVASVIIKDEVANMSLSGSFSNDCANKSPFAKSVKAIAATGARVTIAAGNNSGKLASNYHPGCVNGTNIFTVANMACNKTLWSTSNVGVPPIDWIATGGEIRSTWLNGGYNTISGTSMAAPVVAAICLLRKGAPAQNGTVKSGTTTYKIAVR